MENINIPTKMSIEKLRFETYLSNFKSENRNLPSPKDLARAGFYYDPIPEVPAIKLTCYACGMRVRCDTWPSHLNADEGHRSINRDCLHYNYMNCNAVTREVILPGSAPLKNRI